MMIGSEPALQLILEHTPVLPAEPIGLRAALDYVLAEDIYSEVDIPHFDNSAVDGYAVIAEDTRGAAPEQPVALAVIEEVPAGQVPTRPVTAGMAVKIMTGAPLPAGADAVAMIENTAADQAMGAGPGIVKIMAAAGRGDHIRFAGESVRKGELVIPRGRRLNPAGIAMLASLNRSTLTVIRRPGVAILVTGDELILPHEALTVGKVRNSNTYGLRAQALHYGGVPLELGVARDEPGELRRKIAAAPTSEVLLIAAGVSVGDYDYVKAALRELGTEIIFWQVAQRPGKPLLFGKRGGQLVFGLPGNPVSAMICFELYVRPCLLKMQGKETAPRRVIATLQEPIRKKPGVRAFIRVRLRETGAGWEATTTGPQGSGILKAMVLADGLLILPEALDEARAGEKYEVQLLP